MRHRCIATARRAWLFAFLAAVSPSALGDSHLLLTEAVLTPSTDEFIEIGNPTTSPVALGNYYLCDDGDYALLPGWFGAGPAPQIASTDFMARFPMRDILPAGGIIVVAIDGAGYSDAFGLPADYEILGTDPATPDLLEAYPGSIGFLAGLANGGEGVSIFRWDGLSDLVDDVDMIRLGVPAGLDDIGSKTGLAIDGPDAGSTTTTYLNDAFTMPAQPGTAGIGLSAKRISLELLREVHNGGNGITGDDETTEDIEVTWDSSFTVPTPGSSLAINPQTGVVLSVAKTGETMVSAGQEMTYTIFVQNSGTDPAFNVLVTDTLPAGLTFVSESSPPAVNNFDAIEPEISWVAGTLAAGDSFTIDVTVLVDIGLSGLIINQVDVFTTSLDDDPADNADFHGTTVDPSFAALSMVKTGPAAVVADNEITYTLTIENTGSGPAENVFITDNLPPGLTYVSNDSPPGVVIIDVTEPQLEWDVGTVMPGEMLSIDLTVFVNFLVSGDIENFASVTTTTNGDNPTDNTDSAVTTVTSPAPDISITKAGPATSASGTNTVYQIDVRNNGLGPAEDVIVTDTLPPGLSFVSESSPGSAVLVDSTEPTITWDLGTVAPGAVLTIDLTVAIDLFVSGNIVNAVDLATSSPGDPPGDNADSVITNITIPPPALSVAKSGPGRATKGDQIVYTIHVQNTGPGPAEGVVITDTLPGGLSFAGESSPPEVTLVDSTEPTIVWNAGTMLPGATASISLTAAIELGTTGLVVNDVVVTTTSPGDDPADNADSAATSVSPLQPEISVTKTAPTTAIEGDDLVYTITVANTGVDPADHVLVVDTLPAGLAFVSEDAPPGVTLVDATEPTIGWNAGTIPPGGTVEITLTANISSGTTGMIDNDVAVTTSTPGDDPADNSDTASTNVLVLQPTLFVTKTGPAQATEGENIIYTITVENTGTGPADDVLVTDTLPAGLTFVSQSSPPGFVLIDGTEPTIAWDAGTVGPGAMEVVTLTANIGLGVTAMITNDVEVTTSSANDHPQDNAASATTDVSMLDPSLAITKTAPATAVEGSTIDYTITLQNSGAANGVVITDTLPAGLSFVSESSPAGVTVTDTTEPTIVWDAGSVRAGGSVVITLTARIDAGTIGTIDNDVIVTTTTPGEDPAGNTDTASTNVLALLPALTLTKTGPATAVSGSEITYTLTVQNTGTDDAEGVVVTDTLPPGLSFVGESSPAGVTIIDAVEPELAWDAGTVAAGATLVIDVTAAIDPAVSGDIDNDAAVTTTTPGEDDDDNDDSATTDVDLAPPVLSVTKSGPATAFAGTEIVYTIEVRNDGVGHAHDVILVDILPPELTFVGEISPPGAVLFDATEPNIRWDLDTVPGGETVTVQLSVAIGPTVSGALTNDVAVTTSSPGDDPKDNADAVVTDVTVLEPGLSVTKTTAASALPGEELVYTIVVENAGIGAAAGVVINDLLPPGLDFVSENSPPTVIATDTGDPTISWDAGTIDAGATVVIELTAEIGTSVTGLISNSVTVTTITPGDDPADNTDTAETDVIPLLPMLELTKTGPDMAVNGTEITYTIFVQNDGNSLAQTVRIMDPLPPALTLVSESSPAGVSFSAADGGSTPTWTISTLLAAGTVSVDLTVFIDSSFTGSLVNSAEVTTSTSGEDPAGNVDTAATDVVDPVQPEGIVINEIRISQTGDDKDEYFELAADPGADLNAVTYLVLGDSSSGRIEEVVTLTGHVVPSDGLFLVAQSSFELDPDAVVDLTAPLNFEDSDNVTHLLVFQFTGAEGDDLDLDDDGALDVLPWTAVLDAVGLVEEPNPPTQTEWAYGTALGFVDVGPQGPLVPAHVFRCGPDGAWGIGTQDEMDVHAGDTPDGANGACPCYADTNFDGVVDIDDIVNVVLCLDTDGFDCPGPGDRSDVDFSGTVDIDDIVQVVLNLGPCP